MNRYKHFIHKLYMYIYIYIYDSQSSSKIYILRFIWSEFWAESSFHVHIYTSIPFLVVEYCLTDHVAMTFILLLVKIEFRIYIYIVLYGQVHEIVWFHECVFFYVQTIFILFYSLWLLENCVSVCLFFVFDNDVYRYISVF